MDLRRKKEIVGWIKNHAPQSCFAQNNADAEIDEFFPVEEITDFFYFDDLGFCGCGYTKECERTIMAILGGRFASGGYFGTNNERDETRIGLYDIALKVLDAHEFIDHSGSIYSSFLTEKGKMYLDALREKYGEV